MARGPRVFSSNPPFTNVPRSASPQSFDFDEKRDIADEGIYGKFYGNDADPMADEFEIGSVTQVDPEMGRRRASLLV